MPSAMYWDNVPVKMRPSKLVKDVFLEKNPNRSLSYSAYYVLSSLLFC